MQLGEEISDNSLRIEISCKPMTSEKVKLNLREYKFCISVRVISPSCTSKMLRKTTTAKSHNLCLKQQVGQFLLKQKITQL